MDRTRYELHRLRNRAQTLLLTVALSGLLGGLAWMLGGEGFALLVLVGAMFGFSLTGAIPARVVLGLHRARPIAPREAPGLVDAVRALAVRAGLTRAPFLWYLPGPVPNAVSVGTDGDSGIALSDGLLRSLTFEETVGVLAHEISHVAHRDTRVMAFAALAARITRGLSTLGWIVLFLSFPFILAGALPVSFLLVVALVAAPSVSTLIGLALSRTREFDADREAARLLGDPRPLVAALAKLEQSRSRAFWPWPVRPRDEPPHLRTHPETRERIERLRELSGRPARAGRVATGAFV